MTTKRTCGLCAVGLVFAAIASVWFTHLERLARETEIFTIRFIP